MKLIKKGIMDTTQKARQRYFFHSSAVPLLDRLCDSVRSDGCKRYSALQVVI